MMLDVWRNVLVMGMSALEKWVIGMRLRIIPIQFPVAVPDFIAVPIDYYRQTIIDEPFAYYQPNVVIKEKLTRNSGQRYTASNECNG
jgi:hypothetical protein